MRCLSNIAKNQKPAILEAVAKSGASIQWRDEPDKRMDGNIHRNQFGSIWGADEDYSEFWRLYRKAVLLECNNGA